MRQFIPVEELFAEWEKNPEFTAMYDALHDEFEEYQRQCLAAPPEETVIQSVPDRREFLRKEAA